MPALLLTASTFREGASSLARSVAISLAMSRGNLDCPNCSYSYMTGRPYMLVLLPEYGPDKVGALTSSTQAQDKPVPQGQE